MLWEIGYPNLLMLMATIPVFDPKGKGKLEVKQKIDFGDDVKSLANFINNQQ